MNVLRRSVIRRLGFDIVRGCQLRCIGCPNSTLRTKIKFVTSEDFKTCLQNIDVKRVYLLRLFNFGEPLLHPDVPGLLAIIKGLKFNTGWVEISTNAQHHNFPMLAEIFKVGVLSQVVVSCDGEGTAEDYERLRPPATWDRLMEFLAVASEYRDKYAPNTKLATRIICETEVGRRRWTELLDSLGWIPYFRSWIPLPGSELNPLSSIPLRRNEVCLCLKNYTLYVDYDGTVVPCCAHPRAGTLGNLREQRYSDILNSLKREEFVKSMRSNRRMMPICGKCEVRSSFLAKVENRLFCLTKALPASLCR